MDVLAEAASLALHPRSPVPPPPPANNQASSATVNLSSEQLSSRRQKKNNELRFHLPPDSKLVVGCHWLMTETQLDSVMQSCRSLREFLLPKGHLPMIVAALGNKDIPLFSEQDQSMIGVVKVVPEKKSLVICLLRDRDPKKEAWSGLHAVWENKPETAQVVEFLLFQQNYIETCYRSHDCRLPTSPQKRGFTLADNLTRVRLFTMDVMFILDKFWKFGELAATWSSDDSGILGRVFSWESDGATSKSKLTIRFPGVQGLHMSIRRNKFGNFKVDLHNSPSFRTSIVFCAASGKRGWSPEEHRFWENNVLRRLWVLLAATVAGVWEENSFLDAAVVNDLHMDWKTATQTRVKSALANIPDDRFLQGDFYQELVELLCADGGKLQAGFVSHLGFGTQYRVFHQQVYFSHDSVMVCANLFVTDIHLFCNFMTKSGGTQNIAEWKKANNEEEWKTPLLQHLRRKLEPSRKAKRCRDDELVEVMVPQGGDNSKTSNFGIKKLKTTFVDLTKSDSVSRP